MFGVLEAYDSADNLLQSVQTGLLTDPFGVTQTMTINRVIADIAYVVAYGDSDNTGHDGVTLHNLTYESHAGSPPASVPAPGGAAFLVLAVLALLRSANR